MNLTHLKNILTALLVTSMFLVGCDDNILSEDYDINFPIPTISSLSTSGDVEVGSELTIHGANFQDLVVTINEKSCEIVSVNGDKTEAVINLPRTFDEGPIRVENVYERWSESSELVRPIYLEASVSKVNDIPQGLTFIVEGTNVDMITEVYVNSILVPIVSSDAENLVANVGDLELSPGQLVDVSFKSLSPNTIDPVEKVNVIYPFIEYKELIIADFEDGTHLYVGEPTASIVSGGGDCPGNVDKYFQLRAPGYGWDKATGEMIFDEVPDVSLYVNPYLTFAVRTPAGSAGYFQMEDQAGNWRHFDYGFRTEGEWMIISQPLAEGWEGGTFDARAFTPKLGFKAGNAADNQDVDIAYLKITEGMYDGALEVGDPIGSSPVPATISVMNFEDVSSYPDQISNGVVIGSIDNNLRSADPISAFTSDHFYTYGDDPTAGGWGGYWGNTLSANMQDVDLSGFADPYLSLAMNSGDGYGQQYIILRLYQYDEQLVMVKKFFPESDGVWTNGQFSLFNEDLENWSDDSTDLGAHYKSLKRLNPDVVIDRIEIIISRNGSNEVLVSFDELTITEGPRY